MAVVIGVGVFVVWQWRESSVESHMERYWNAYYGPHRLERLWYKVAALLGRPVNAKTRETRRERRMAAEEQWLIESGYLQKRSYFCVGTHPNIVAQRLVGNQAMFKRYGFASWYEIPMTSFRFLSGETNEIVRIGREGPFGVVIVAPKTNMPKWERRLNEADRVDIVIW